MRGASNGTSAPSCRGGSTSTSPTVAGFAPTGTTRVTHRAAPGGGAVSDLTVQEVTGSPWVVWHGFVAVHSPTSEFTAYASDGSVLKAW